MSTTDWARQRERLVGHLLTGDAARASAEVRQAIADGATPGTVYTHLITPALHHIGHHWADGDVGVAQEHRASQICVTIIAQLSELFHRRGPIRGAAATLTAPDEQHAIASAMVADVLRAAGYTVHHLGAGVPARDLAIFLAVVPVDLVCFSVTHELPADQYPVLMRASRDANPETVVIFGGQGVDADAVTGCGGMVVSDLAALTEVVERL